MLDPAGGSWYVESLTDALAQAAWDWFTEIERAGGLVAALASGLVARPDRRRLGRPRRSGWPPATDAITGVSEFPNLAEKLPDARARGAGAADRRAAAGAGRRRSSRSCATRPTRGRAPPTVYLATIGPVARHTARADLRRQPVPGRRARDAVRRRRRGLRRGGDDGRLHLRHRQGLRRVAPPALAAELRAAGATQVWLAGKPDLASTASTATCSPAATPSTSLRDRARASWGVTGMSAIPDFGSVELGRPASARLGRRLGQGVRGDDRPRRGGGDLGDAGGHRRPAAVHPRRPAGLDFLDTYPGHRALPARALPDDVHDPAVDGPAVRRASPPPRSPTPSTGATSPPGRRGCRSPSTCPPTAATTPTTRGWPATSAWPASRSTRSSTCGSSSTASRWTR